MPSKAKPKVALGIEEMASRRRVMEEVGAGIHGPDGPWVFVVWHDPAKTTQNRLHALGHYAAAQVRKTARKAGYAAWQGAGSPRESRPVVVHCLIRRGGKAQDALNLWGSVKSQIDGVLVGQYAGSGRARLFHPAMLPDDSGEYVTLGTIHEVVSPQFRDDPHLVVSVHLLDPEQPPRPVTHAAVRPMPIERKRRS